MNEKLTQINTKIDDPNEIIINYCHNNNCPLEYKHRNSFKNNNNAYK